MKGVDMLDDKRITNRYISEHYRDCSWYFCKSDFVAAFGYWVIQQSPYFLPDISDAMRAFGDYVLKQMGSKEMKEFTYSDLNYMINEAVFEHIPAIMKLNVPTISTGLGYEDRHNNPHPDYDFIDLGALARNVFYMLIREHITQD